MYEWSFMKEREKGRAEGRAEGVEIGQVKLIINMIKYNMPLETIANSTKVALEKVRQIAKEHNLLVEKSI